MGTEVSSGKLMLSCRVSLAAKGCWLWLRVAACQQGVTLESLVGCPVFLRPWPANPQATQTVAWCLCRSWQEPHDSLGAASNGRRHQVKQQAAGGVVHVNLRHGMWCRPAPLGKHKIRYEDMMAQEQHYAMCSCLQCTVLTDSGE